MRRVPAAVVVAACAITLGASGCAHANRPVVLERPAAAPVSRLSDLPSMPGAYVLVLRVTGDGFNTRRMAEEDIVCLARRVGKSTTARGWFGALIGAAVSLPFGISMAGDMMMPAAIAGALIAGNTGQPKARVLLDRSHLGGGERACPALLRAIPDTPQLPVESRIRGGGPLRPHPERTGSRPSSAECKPKA